MAESEGVFAGVCLSKDLRFVWTDSAVLYMLPAFRGQRIATELYGAAWKRAQERQRHVVTLSRNPAVVRLMERLGMEVGASLRKAPFALHLHINRPTMSLYRLQETIRKSRAMKNAPPLLCGTKRYRPPDAFP